MKILFCIYQLDFADHIAIPYLSAVAKSLGHSTDLCVMAASNLSDMVRTLSPDVVAYSANIQGFEEMVAAHKNALTVKPFISIMGGPQATFSPDTFTYAGVDAYCIGEGELPFKEFLQRLEQNQPYDDILNLITPVRRNEVRPFIENLEHLPIPDRDITLSHSFLRFTPKKTFYTTRGCPFNCHYCANSYYKELYRGKGTMVRRFSVERVLKEIENVKATYRTEFIKFGDDVFALHNDAWLEEFTDKYPNRIGIPFNCFLRLDTVDYAMLTMLKRAGCYSVHLSVDSTSEYVRETILVRKMRKVDIVQKLKMIHSYDIKTWVNFMLAAPGSTLEGDLDTIRLSKAGQTTYSNYSTTVPMAGTVLFNYCVDHKLIDHGTHVSDMKGCTEPSTLTCFTKKDKNSRYNIFLLGPIIAKLPFPLDKLAIMLIKNIPPNFIFKQIHDVLLKYYLENKIFSLHKKSAL
jgi:radical SAM superfamily enzyme YgiQ (UPF0313 family)